ncbi:C8orf82 family protein [Megaselia abdita]
MNALRTIIKYNNRQIYNGSLRNLSYVQGQEPIPGRREYFYYINHEGMLFLDDARIKNFTSCFKEKKFLQFFFSRIKVNDTDKYSQEFPFISPCGRESNYIRCDDLPIVYTHIIEKDNQLKLTFGYAGDLLTAEFDPQKIFMNPKSGRVYHPASEKVGKIGLIRSKLAIELSKSFEFENGDQNPPTHIIWNGKKLLLDFDWVKGIEIKNEFEE